MHGANVTAAGICRTVCPQNVKPRTRHLVAAGLDRVSASWNRRNDLTFCFDASLFEKPVPTFSDLLQGINPKQKDRADPAGPGPRSNIFWSRGRTEKVGNFF
jgi:hypothetical protein